MNTPAKPPGSLLEFILGWIQNRLGLKGVFLFLFLGAAGSVAWNWESITSNAMYEHVRAEFFPEPIPVIERGVISILVANLHGDIGHKFRQSLTSDLIPQNLPVGHWPIRIYKLDRYIGGTSNEVISALQEGQAKARELLKQTKADLLVWGSLQGPDKSPTPLIFVTASGDGYSKVNAGTDIKIPGTERIDMQKLLRVVALTEWAQLEKEDGTAIDEAFIDQLTTTFKALQLYSNESGIAKQEADTIVARSKARIGRAYDSPQLLEQALAGLQSVAKTLGLDTAIKADVELGLGLAHFGLADVNPARYAYQDALVHYQLAWKLVESGDDTRRKAQALIGIAGSHLALYQKNQKEEDLQEAADHAQKAHSLIDKAQYAGDWCQATQTLAVARRTFGEIKRDQALVQQSIELLQDVLALRGKELVPVFWANTKNSLGNVLSSKAALTDADQDYVAAVDHYQGALEVFDIKRFPLMYATVTMNLALAEENHWQRKREETIRQRSLEHYQTAKAVFQQLKQNDRLLQAASGIARLEQPASVAATEQVAKDDAVSQEKIEAVRRGGNPPLDKVERLITRSLHDKAEMSHKMWSELKSPQRIEKQSAAKK